MTYLGHFISQQGVEADPEKLQAIWAWPQPFSATILRIFLGQKSYSRCFVKHYTSIASPLTDMFSPNSFL